MPRSLKNSAALSLFVLLLGSLKEATGTPCPLLVLASLPISESTRVELSQELWMVGSSESTAYEFVMKYGHSRILDVLPSTEAGGINNRGMILFDHGGQTRRIKLLKEADGRTPVIEMIRTLEGYALGELQGSARVCNFGPISFDGREMYYLEMEEMFPGEKTFSFKENYDLKSAGQLRSQILEAIAEKYVQALEADILPDDPDFLIAKSGEVRWLDTQFWKRIPREAYDSESSLMSFFGKAWSFWMFYIGQVSPENEFVLKTAVLNGIARSEKLDPLKQTLLKTVLSR